MPQNFERNFRKAVINLKHKKKIILRRKIQAFFKSTIQYWLLFVLILSAVITGLNPHLIKDFAVWLRYTPVPPSVASPWSWNNNQKVHPIVANITPDIESSIKSVAEYIASQESDPYLRVKALHDYVISRVSYDFNAVKTGIYPPQDAQAIFSMRKAVCGGYANLFMALAQSIGMKTAVIQGDIRQDLAPPSSVSTNTVIFNPYTKAIPRLAHLKPY